MCEHHSLQRVMSLSCVRDFEPGDQPLRRSTQALIHSDGSSSQLRRRRGASEHYLLEKGNAGHVVSLTPRAIQTWDMSINCPRGWPPRKRRPLRASTQRLVYRREVSDVGQRHHPLQRGVFAHVLYAINTSRPHEPSSLTDWAADINTPFRHDTHS